MSNVPSISVTHTFNGDVAATAKVNAAQLDTQLGNLAVAQNQTKAVLDRITDGNNDLAPDVVGRENLTGELRNVLDNLEAVEAQTAGVNSAAIVLATGSTNPRTLSERFADHLTVKDYGAIGNGVTNDAGAVSAMAAEVGFVRFPRGGFLLNTVTIDAPVMFDEGAYITVPVGQTVSIRDRIESDRQWIFRGDGTYDLGHDADSGENARNVHASWFGAFPYPGNNPVDQAPFINKAFASMGNLRESVVQFDMGNYMVRSQVTVTRGGWVKGSGTRRTVFLHDTDGFVSFVTSGVACRFSDIQFELRPGGITNRVSAFIQIDHNDAEVFNCRLGYTEKGIIVGADNVSIRDVAAVYGDNKAAGSNLIWVRSGGQVSAENINVNTSTFGPEAIIKLGGLATVSGIQVSDVSSICPAKVILVDATAGNASRLILTNIRYNGFSGVAPSSVIHLLTGSTFTCEDVSVSDVAINSYASNGIRLEQNSSGNMRDIFFDNVTISGTSGNGFEFVRTAGSLTDVYIGNNVDVTERATPYFYSGATSGFRINPAALPGVLPGYCYGFSIPDDGVAQIALQRSSFNGWLMVSVGTSERGIYTYRAASSPTASAYGTPTANMGTATTVLTGTTGVDGRFTIGVVDGSLYFENRLGSTATVSVALLTGF